MSVHFRTLDVCGGGKMPCEFPCVEGCGTDRQLRLRRYRQRTFDS